MRRPLVALIVASFLAGCADSEEPVATGGTNDLTPSATDAAPALNFTAGIPVPAWNIGDWWQYTVDYSSGEKFEAKIVVYAQEGGNYLVTADNAELTMRAAFNHYPTISPVTRATQDQFIHGVQVPFLKFPMKNQTWTAQYRDFQMSYESTYAMLDAAGENVPGFTTTMKHPDGKARMVHDWSPVTKWFTGYTWDFDGTAPVDVTVKLKAWGSNFTGSLPVVNLAEIVHRQFPTTSAPPPTQAPTPPHPHHAFKIGAAGSTLVVGYFAGAGGPGSFEIDIQQQGGAAGPTRYEWRPQAAGSIFQMNKIQNPAVGDWQLAAGGAAQNSAFLFVEAYEAKTTQLSLD